jgi:isopentenyl phosphate kinase
MATNQDVLSSTANLLKRVNTEGITQNGQVVAQPGAFDMSGAPVVDSGKDGTQLNIADFMTNFPKAVSASDGAYKSFQDASTQLAQKSQERTGLLQGLIQKRETEKANMPTQQELQTQALAQYGITPDMMQSLGAGFAQITQINKDLADIEARKQADIDAIHNRTGSTINFANAEEARIAREYNREIAAKSAQASAITAGLNYYKDVSALAQSTIQALTYDAQQKVSDIEWAISTYSDLYGDMDKADKELLDNAYSLYKDELAIKTAEANKKTELIKDAAKYGVNIGQYVNSSYEDLFKMYTSQVSAKQAETGLTGGINSKVESDFREDGASLKLQVRAGAMTNEEAYQQLRDLYSPNEVSDDYIRNYLGISQPTEITQTQSSEQPVTQISTNKKLSDRISALFPIYENTGWSWKVDLRKKLLDEGFTKEDVASANIPGGAGSFISQGFNNFKNELTNFLFKGK